MDDRLLLSLRNEVRKFISDCKTFVTPLQPDGKVDLDALIPIIFKHLNVSLKQEHFNTDNDNRDKSNVKSTIFREDGYKLLVGKNDHDNLIKALDLFTRSIAHAVPGSKEISLAYANRAAVLFSGFDRAEAALEDIDRAIELGCPEKLLPKLLNLQGDYFCKLATESFIESKSWLRKIPKKEPGRKELVKQLKDYPLKEAEIVDEECIIPEIKSPSKRFPCASDAVDIDYSMLNGQLERRLIATRDIDVGEVLVVEKHYFKSLKLDRLYTHCAYCLVFLLNGIPCGTCKNAMYCSEKCRAEAWTEYHEIECPIFGLLIQTPQMNVAIGSVRLLMEMCHEAGGLKLLKKRVEEFNTLTDTDQPLLVQDEWYQKPSLESILTLSTNESNAPTTMVQEIAELALCSLFVVASRTNFFGTHCKSPDMFDTLTHSQEMLFFAKLFVRLVLKHRFNSLLTKDEDSALQIQKGKVLSPFASFFNHSCFHNVDYQYKKDHFVFRSQAPVKKGEELTIYYCPPWFYETREKRQACLKEVHYMTCSCRACKENWPLLNGTVNNRPHLMVKNFQINRQPRQVQVLFSLMNLYSIQLCGRNLREKDEMLSYLYAAVRHLYNHNFVPCFQLGYIQGLIYSVYRMTGNTAKLQKAFARK